MIQRIALLAGGIGAAAVLAFALGAGNLITFGAQAPALTADNQPAQVDVAVANSSVQPDVSAAAGKQNGTRNDQNVQPAQTKTKIVVDKVYIAPTPTPKVVRVHPSAQPTPPAATQPTPPPAEASAPRSHDDGYSDDSEGEHSERDHHGDDHERGDD